MLLDQYYETLDKLIEKVRTTQRDNIIKAGEMIAESVENGKGHIKAGLLHELLFLYLHSLSLF